MLHLLYTGVILSFTFVGLAWHVSDSCRLYEMFTESVVEVTTGRITFTATNRPY